MLAAILTACARQSPPLDPPRAVIVGTVRAVPLNVIDGGGADTTPRHRAGTRSYQEALVELDMGSRDARDLTAAELTAPARNASFVAGCGAPDSMKVTVRAVVRDGHAVGVTVTTRPTDPTIEECVVGHIRELTWPTPARPSAFTTTY